LITGSVAKAEPISDKVKITIETSYDYYMEAAQLLMASKSRGEKIIIMPEQTTILTDSRDDILKGLLEQTRTLVALITEELSRVGILIKVPDGTELKNNELIAINKDGEVENLQ